MPPATANIARQWKTRPLEKLLNAYHPTARLERYLSEQIVIRNEDWLIRAYRAQRGLLLVSGHYGFAKRSQGLRGGGCIHGDKSF